MQFFTSLRIVSYQGQQSWVLIQCPTNPVCLVFCINFSFLIPIRVHLLPYPSILFQASSCNPTCQRLGCQLCLWPKFYIPTIQCVTPHTHISSSLLVEYLIKATFSFYKKLFKLGPLFSPKQMESTSKSTNSEI